MIILASNSEARIRLLNFAGVVFAHRAHLAKEGPGPADETAIALASRLAREKALSLTDVASNDIVIGSDQVLQCEGRVLGKAASLEELKTHLEFLRGRSHFLHSAVACVQEGQLLFETTATARLKMRHFSNDALQDYLAGNGEALLGCVGGYQIEAEGVRLFEEIEGDSFTIQGIPLLPLLAFLRSRSLVAT